jgi:hypothetical protein
MPAKTAMRCLLPFPEVCAPYTRGLPPFYAAYIVLPGAAGIVWDQEYDIEVHQLAKLLWAQKSPMAAEQHQLSKHFDVLTGDWVVSEGDAEAIVRTVTMRSSAPIVGEHTLTDRQELKRLGSMYVLKSAVRIASPHPTPTPHCQS